MFWKKKKEIRYKCSSCDKIHYGVPHLSMVAPDSYLQLSEEEKEKSFLSDDLCVVRADYGDFYYIKSVLIIPVEGGNEDFTVSLWTSQSRENYDHYEEHMHEDLTGRKTFAYIGNNIPGYENTHGLESVVVFGDTKERPAVHFQSEESQVSIDHSKGVSLERVMSITGSYHLKEV